MARIKAFIASAVALPGGAAIAIPAWAEEAVKDVYGVQWGMGLQPAASPIAESMHDFHELLLWIITIIAFFVLGLLLWVMFRFSEKKNPTPSKTTHNTLIEVIWTVVPVLILVIIAIPSFRLLYMEDEVQDGDITIKAIGNAWYWSYEYQDPAAGKRDSQTGENPFSYEEFAFDSYMLQEDELSDPGLRLLEVDTVAYIPSDTKVRFIVTSADTLHSFAMPAWGIKIDAVPGRLNETWVAVPGKWEGVTFYGQCSEICGTNHAYMPIAFKVVSPDDYLDWVKKTQEAMGNPANPAVYARNEVR
ncbi:MAG: cytochrome c oxidase subunit II [Rhodospirillales bacterium]|nr:cytochrome c oxidase subunit II [Rhodospirillales bacterium]